MASPQSLALAPEGRTRGAVASVARSVGPGQTGTSSGLRGHRPRGAALCCSQVQRPSAQHECGHARPGGGSGVPRAEEWGSQGTFPGVAPATEGASHTPVTSVHGPTHTYPAPGSDAAGHSQTRGHTTSPAPPRTLAHTSSRSQSHGAFPARHWLPAPTKPPPQPARRAPDPFPNPTVKSQCKQACGLFLCRIFFSRHSLFSFSFYSKHCKYRNIFSVQ